MLQPSVELALVGRLALAVFLAGLIGIERELRQKHAGLRTHALVGLGAALFLEVSAYGFGDVLASGRIVLDPSRVAAQVVSGIGFIGGGLVFVRRASVRGLTTAGSIWLAAAVGMAAGAGMWVEASAATGLGFVVIAGMQWVERVLPSGKQSVSALQVTYRDGDGTLEAVTKACTNHGSDVRDVRINRQGGDPALAIMNLQLRRPRERGQVVRAVSEVDGVVEVATGDGMDE
ncbi:MAG: MgtC/SapB family protein [Candidatus Dormibacteraeota bacterium]|nr:MgtC/SapB family protein [Candidatus Dormibacteraeota bacterium]